MLRNSTATAAAASIRSERPRALMHLAESWLQRRRSRRALAELDERLLRDIGLSPSQASTECAMPFWKPFVWLQRK